jgi:hypothetical protein
LHDPEKRKPIFRKDYAPDVQRTSVKLAAAILIDGVIDASWLFIVAVGLTLVFGVLNILNSPTAACSPSAPMRRRARSAGITAATSGRHRLSSGSYFPPLVRRVERDGRFRSGQDAH